ncbi:MAG: HEAT repeat domain-containing protein, partial [Planctomycetes bacterium]|nr:HEAT repeat domain-containing protein [Planctomycetota bacterium]
DMYRETIEHPWSIPDDIKAHLDLESGRDRGRIYRLTPPGFHMPAPPRLGAATTEELVAQLENPNCWWRDTAHWLLYERGDRLAVPLLRKLMKESRRDLTRLHSLWSLEGLATLETADLLTALCDESPNLREDAVRLAASRAADDPELLENLLALADDPAIRVRFHVAFALGDQRSPSAVHALSRIARRDAADPWVRTAVLSSATDSAGALLIDLVGDSDFCAREPAATMLQELASLVVARNQPDKAAEIVAKALTLPAKNGSALPAIVIGLAGGLKRSNKSLNDLLSNLPADPARAVTDVLAGADRTAQNNGAPAELRQQAIQLLGYGDFDRVRGTLTGLLDIRQHQAIQIAAVRALSGFRESGVSEILLSPYRSLTPAVRGEVVEALLARNERVAALFDAIEASTVPAGDVPLNRRSVLLNHSDAAIRGRAAALFAGSAPGPRPQVFAQYKAALPLAADRQRGEKILDRECLTCHRWADRGHDVGPNLETIRHWAPEQLLANILDPNREVAPNYLEYAVALDDGRITTGMIASETPASITLRRAEKVEETILRSNIAEITASGKSLMPEGLEKKITVQEMADLVKYLLDQ